MPRNGFFGVKNAHIALCEDTDALTYATPIHVQGTVEIKATPSVNTSTSYADNQSWIEKQQDNGGSGTMSFYDTESTPALRALFAKLTGYEVDAAGRVLGSSDKDPQWFALMCEQPGHVVGKRRCYLMCQLTKPSMDAKTVEDKPDITQLDYDFTWKPVTLSSGWRGCHYDSYSDLDDYDKFFDEVDTAITPKAEG